MVDLTDLAPPDRIFASVKAASKKQLLLDLATRIAPQLDIEQTTIFEALTERERLGATGVGRGVAIPHCRLPGLQSIVGAFARLETPIEFDAIDGAPVDLIFLLAAPECAGAEHLKALAKVSRALRDDALCEKLRGAQDAAAIQALLSTSQQVAAA